MSDDPSLPPLLDNVSLSALEGEFYAQYGATLANWARLEQTLSSVFCTICDFSEDDPLGPALFFSGKSFNTRCALLGAASRNSDLEEPVQEVIRALLKKARQFETARNKIAHGYPSHLITSGVDWQGWTIKEGDEAHIPGGIGVDKLKQAAVNFGILQLAAGRAYYLVRHWRAGRKMPPTEHLELIRWLPNDAFLRAEGQSPPRRSSPSPEQGG